MSTTGNVIGFVVAVAVAAMVKQGLSHKTPSGASGDDAAMETRELTAAEVDKKLNEVADKLNQSTPKKVDRETVLESVGTGTKEIRYNFSLPNLPASQIAPEAIRAARDMHVEHICSAKEMRPLFKNGVTVVYTYTGNDGGFVTDIHITPSDCRI